MFTFDEIRHPLVGFQIIPYYAMTFARLRPLLHILGQDEHILGIEARLHDVVTGLTLVQKHPEEQSANVLSIFVEKTHRNSGVGAGMLNYVEDLLIKEGYQKITLSYRDDLPAASQLEKLLTGCHWSPPQVDMIMVKGLSEDICGADWLTRKRKLPPGYELFFWVELTANERQAILDRQESEESWYPEKLSPFRDEHIMEPLNSLGLRYQGQVVGWMINHRTNPDTIRYTPLFVSEEVRSLSAGLILITEAIRLGCQIGIERYFFLYEPGSPIQQWVNRRFSDCAQFYKVLKSEKILEQHQQ